MPPEAAEWNQEYLYRRAFPGLTHDQYLDEPGDAIEWLLRVDLIHRQIEAEQEQQKQRG